MGKHIDLSGMRFGRLLVLRRAESQVSSGKHAVRWVCQCDCGMETTARTDTLKGGKVKSCGCLAREVSSVNGKRYGGRVRHGHSYERLFNIWYLMKYRCENTKSKAFHNYGGRGIIVCEEWSNAANGYQNFKRWAYDNGYMDTLTLDRVDNERGYEPDNCRWCDRVEQGNNKRNNILYEFSGKSQTLTTWAREYLLPPKTLWRRIHAGWDIERALTEPLRK